MQFTSLAFAIFLACIFLLYWAAPAKHRQVLLLVASYGFYATFSFAYVGLLLVISLMTYGAALCKKSWVSTASIILQAAVLLGFKYAGLLPFTPASIVIPVGLSFYIFKAISYLADVKKEVIQPERNITSVLLYLSFFPDIVSGPINRAKELIPQLKAEKHFDYDTAVYGLRLVLLGLFKKFMIADVLAVYVDVVFDAPYDYTGISFLLAFVMYTVEIYCDFAGYSDMAIGVARLFGIRSMDNFKSPYFATSITDFWNRWHISLSTWLKDYIYIPLGGSRRGDIKRYFNLMITFFVSGIWHGASLTFLLWGLLHGLYQVGYRLYKKVIKGNLPTALARLVTLCFVSFAWIFFRAGSLGEACFMITHVFDDLSLHTAYEVFGMDKVSVVSVAIAMAFLALYDWVSLKRDLLKDMSKLPTLARWGIYVVVSALVLTYHLHGGSSQAFIYFQF